MQVGTSQGISRYDQIVAMIEECEKLKSNTEHNVLNLADKLVPFSLGGTALAYLLPRNVSRAISIPWPMRLCRLPLTVR